jgi:tRNA G18 (ribose-2'-O)-methylase SpoU
MKIEPLGLPIEVIRRDLDQIRRPLHIAILRAKNPFNVGAIIRVAHSFLVREIVLVGDAPYYERASMGMEKYENIVEVPDEAALIQRARDKKLPIVVLEKDHAKESLWRAELPGECMMVFGSEDFGVGQELIDVADQIVAIPMYGINHSFPLAIAAGIAMAEWTRRYVEPVK